jgi:hypothetical protein
VARPASSIQAEIDTLETFLQSTDALYQSIDANGIRRTIDRTGVSTRLDQLYVQLGRVNGSAPMIVRGVLDGLR